MVELDGKVAMVTGGGSGLGAKISEAMNDAGARVYLFDKDEAQVTEAAIGMKNAVGLHMDVTSERSIRTGVDHIVTNEGRIDILVNCAGVYGMQPWLEVTEDEFDRIFSTNVRGLLIVTQTVAPHMIEQGGGSIVNVASATGRRGNPLSVAYSASKMAVISLTQSSALAFASYGVRVNAIAPGPIDTPMWNQVTSLYKKDTDQNAVLNSVVADIPLGRISKAEDHIGAVLFLTTDASQYITGQTLNVDGGLYLN
jgi:galactitol 2-dehydrogenase